MSVSYTHLDVYKRQDLLSQAEHDPMASAILVTTSSKLLENVNKELAKQTAVLPKREIVEQSLKNYEMCIRDRPYVPHGYSW